MKSNYFSIHKNKKPKRIHNVSDNGAIRLKRYKLLMVNVIAITGASTLSIIPFGLSKEELKLYIFEKTANTALGILRALDYNPQEHYRFTGIYGRKPKNHKPIDSYGFQEAIDKLKELNLNKI